MCVYEHNNWWWNWLKCKGHQLKFCLGQQIGQYWFYDLCQEVSRSRTAGQMPAEYTDDLHLHNYGYNCNIIVIFLK